MWAPATRSPGPTASTRTSSCRAPTSTRPRRALRRRRSMRCCRTPRMVAFFQSSTAAVRPAAPPSPTSTAAPRRRNRPPICGAQAHQRPSGAAGASGEAAPATLRNLLPRHGNHGRARPAEVPARHALHTRPSGTRTARQVPHHRPGHRAHGTQLVNGPALIARLALSAHDLGVHLWTSSPAARLSTDGWRVVGRGRRPAAAAGRRSALGGACCSPPGAFRTTSTCAGRFFPARRRAANTGPWPPNHHRRRDRARGVRRRRLQHPPGLPGGLLPGLAGVVPQRPVGVFPHIVDRGKPGVIGVLSTGRRFVNEADGYYQYADRDDRQCARGRGGRVVADLRPRVPAALPLRDVQAVPGAGVALHPLGLSAARPDAGGAGAQVRDRPARARRDRRGFNRHARKGRDPEFGRGEPRRSTAGRATPSTGPTRRSHRSRRPRSTPSRSFRAASAPSRACAPTRVRGCSTRPAPRFRACGLRAATRPTSWAGTTRRVASTSAPR